MSGTVTLSDVLVEGTKGFEFARGLGREEMKREMLVSCASSEVEGSVPDPVCNVVPPFVVGFLVAEGSNSVSGGD